MKSIGAGTTGSVDTVVLIMIHRWMRTYDLEAEAVRAAELVGHFDSFRDSDISRDLAKHADMWGSFWEFAQADEVCREVYEHIKSFITPVHLKYSFNSLTSSELGPALKRSAWWKERAKEMDGERKRIRKVKEVMKS